MKEFKPILKPVVFTAAMTQSPLSTSSPLSSPSLSSPLSQEEVILYDDGTITINGAPYEYMVDGERYIPDLNEDGAFSDDEDITSYILE